MEQQQCIKMKCTLLSPHATGDSRKTVPTWPVPKWSQFDSSLPSPTEWFALTSSNIGQSKRETPQLPGTPGEISCSD